MTEKEILLTVVVTVYNVESYVEQCILSIINQTYKKLDIILIDDGSADTSGVICDRYADKDGRIRVIHKENAGLVAARCQGVRLARGTALAFVDGDDWIDQNMYENMMTAYRENSADLITAGMIWEYENKAMLLHDSVAEGIYEASDVRNDVLPRLMLDKRTGRPGIIASVCNKVFNRTLLSDVMKQADSRLTLGEDGAITYSFVPYTKRIQVLNGAWYHYRQHAGSMLTTYGLDDFERIYRLKKCLLGNYAKLGIAKEMEHQVQSYMEGFLYGAIKAVYDVDVGIVTHIFPYEKVPKGSKVILYGAGTVGKSYWKCLQNGEYAEIVSWTDKEHAKLHTPEFPVEPLDDAVVREYDYIVIAVENRITAGEIQKNLLDYGIKREKIIWEQPNRLT